MRNQIQARWTTHTSRPASGINASMPTTPRHPDCPRRDLESCGCDRNQSAWHPLQ